MKFWPHKSFLITSPFNAKQFTNELMQHTEKRASGYYWYRREGISFTGEVGSNKFSVYKTVPYWNLSPVKINGDIMLEAHPLVIKIKMYNSFTLPVSVLLILVSAGLIYNYAADPPWVLLTGLFIVFYLIINIPFQIEAAKAKKILLEITQGAIVSGKY